MRHRHFFHHHRNHRDFHQFHKYFRWVRPGVILFNLLFLYVLFSWVGNTAILLLLVAFIAVKEVIHLFFLRRLERRLFAPVQELDQGVKEIAKGNYDVSIDCDIPNEIGALIVSFNEMARKLREGEKLKQEYEENRKTLIANISHDIKTPITAIQGHVEALLEGVPDSPERAEKYLKTIHRNTIYINKLIDDLFLFSQLDLGKLALHRQTLSIRPFMQDLMEEFKFELEERQCAFTFNDRLAQEHHVSIDGKRINQAVRNIIGNAVKYGPERDLAITVELYQEGDFICLSIQDNGPGIPSEKLAFVFDRFYRIDRARTKDLGSTGLGLAIAKELIEAHGGAISLSSKENEGARFIIALPVERSDHEANPDH
ncbi:sensor histidine kinase [Heliomicrobium gestii]|uniref:sensor histidine kinase n=1 Tax=Heliomicrobium gestii TaxID=2699 RepID=UPI002E28E8A5|nr:HAMP domain-containing sensor histidine kinase [Heliomicrobium gestii]MBM7866861.1 signal transduction histidine kinase [Heliomicrobium gestii]